jgi:branched-chain amino acid transport system permease protein
MSRFVDSPLGRTLQAIRDNELRAEALGYRTFVAQIISSSFASVVATVLGGCYAMWVRYVNPESSARRFCSPRGPWSATSRRGRR